MLTLFVFGNRSKKLVNMVAQKKPGATAEIRGDSNYPKLYGIVAFYSADSGVIVVAELRGLPTGTNSCNSPVLGFHIHEHGRCSGSTTSPFSDAGEHYNPQNCPHPFHAGDLPPLFSNNGFAWMAFYTDRFTVDEIIGRSVIVHDSSDDFKSQPSGDSGKRIGCGVIIRR